MSQQFQISMIELQIMLDALCVSCQMLDANDGSLLRFPSATRAMAYENILRRMDGPVVGVTQGAMYEHPGSLR